MRKYIPLAVSVIALLLVGVLAFLAAPRATKPVVSGPLTSSAGSIVSGTSANGVVSAPIPLVTTPEPTDTPVPPAPTATPVPPVPTATPAPAWHTIGSFHGSTAQSLGVLTLDGPWRISYTCEAGSGIQFNFSAVAGQPDSGAAFTMASGICDATHTSGTLTGGQATDTVWNASVTAYQENGSKNGTGNWTTVIEVFR